MHIYKSLNVLINKLLSIVIFCYDKVNSVSQNLRGTMLTSL